MKPASTRTAPLITNQCGNSNAAMGETARGLTRRCQRPPTPTTPNLHQRPHGDSQSRPAACHSRPDSLPAPPSFLPRSGSGQCMAATAARLFRSLSFGHFADTKIGPRETRPLCP
jgi:hypothetical protein